MREELRRSVPSGTRSIVEPAPLGSLVERSSINTAPILLNEHRASGSADDKGVSYDQLTHVCGSERPTTTKKVLAPQTTARLDSRAMPKDKGHPVGAQSVEDDGRRLFLKLGVHGLGAGVAAVTAGPAIAYLAFPLVHDTTTGAGGYVTVGRTERFKEGVPLKVDLLSDKMDAWNRIEQVKIGSAWILNTGGKLTAYSTVCPHLGCAIDFEAASGKFKCPCHRSAFGQNGEVEEGPSPRPMDTLDVKEEGGLISIQYLRYKIGVADKQIV